MLSPVRCAAPRVRVSSQARRGRAGGGGAGDLDEIEEGLHVAAVIVLDAQHLVRQVRRPTPEERNGRPFVRVLLPKTPSS